MLHRLLNGVGTAAHDDNHLFGVRRADVIEELVLTSDKLGELVHRILDDLGRRQIELVDGFASLEVDVGVLGGSAQERAVGRKGPRLVGRDQIVVDHRPHVVISQLFDLLNLVAGPEPVEEVHERHARS